jgi:hypothetical protein
VEDLDGLDTCIRAELKKVFLFIQVNNCYEDINIRSNYMNNNIITIASDNSKKKKGGGTNAVLVLLKDLGDFQDKVQACIEAQDIEQQRSKVEAFYDQLDNMAQTLLDMAGNGIRSRRNPQLGMDAVDERPEIDDPAVIESPTHSSNSNTVSAPTTPRMPR